MKVYNKKDLTLKEEYQKEKVVESMTFGELKQKIREDISKSNAYVKSNGNSSLSSLGSDLNKSKTVNPMDNNFVVDLSSYDNNQNNDEATIDINAKNGTDAQRKIQNTLASNPQLKTMANNNKLNANVNLTNEQRKRGVAITKREFRKQFEKQ